MIVPFNYRGDASRRMRIVIANGTAGIEEQRGEDLTGGERWHSVDLDASTHDCCDADCDASSWVEMVALAVASATLTAEGIDTGWAEHVQMAAARVFEFAVSRGMDDSVGVRDMIEWLINVPQNPTAEVLAAAAHMFVDTGTPEAEAHIASTGELSVYGVAEDLRAGDVLVHEGRTMVIERVGACVTGGPLQSGMPERLGVGVVARGGRGITLSKGQTVSILRRPRPTEPVGATITNESADHFGPTIEIPDLATAREYVGRVALLGHRDVPGWRESICDDAGICWGPSSGTLSIGDRDRILSTAIMAPGVTATSRSIHDGVVIRLLDVGETIPEPPAEQVVRRRGSRTLQMPESTPHQVARVLFDIADALRLDTDAAWAIEDLAAEVELAAAVMAKAGLS